MAIMRKLAVSSSLYLAAMIFLPVVLSAATGICYSDNMRAFFEAYGEDNELWFSLIEADADNMPDYDSAQDLMFTKIAGGSAPVGDGGVRGLRAPPTTSLGRRAEPAGEAPVEHPFSHRGGPRVTTGDPTRTEIPTSGRSGGTYRHPAGFTFWYPAGWTAQINAEVLQLIPPDPGSSADGPTEIYVVVGESVGGEGISAAEDPRIVEYMNQQVRSLSPSLSLQGNPRPVPMSQGNGVELTWEGKSPKGDVIQARAFVAILEGHGISLVGIALRDLLQARDADLRQMFSSFAFGERQNDPAVVGSWRLVSTSAIDSQSPFETTWSRAQAVSETETVLHLGANGSCTWNSKTQTIVGAGDIWLEDNSSSTNNGRWNAGNGILYIMWENDTYRDCMYRVENAGGGPKLRMACGGKGEVWEPAR